MKAYIIKQPATIETFPLTLVEKEIPELLNNQVLLKVSKCGLCHTDLHIVEGELKLTKYPVVPGHQIVGKVIKIGKNVSELKEGVRVGVAWLHKSCGLCKYCKRGMENLCENALFTGCNVDGGFAEYVASDADFTYRLPMGFDDVQIAPLLCAGIIGYRSFKLIEPKPGDKIGLYGFGASAHIVIQIAIHKGANIYVFTRSQKHKDLALQLGAIWVGNSEDKPPEELDSAIIFAPVGNLYTNALKAVRKGGIVASAGIYMSDIPQFPYELLYYERKMISVANSTRQDAKELLSLAAEIPIITKAEIFPFKEINRALLLLKQGKINGAAVLDCELST